MPRVELTTHVNESKFAILHGNHTLLLLESVLFLPVFYRLRGRTAVVPAHLVFKVKHWFATLTQALCPEVFSQLGPDVLKVLERHNVLLQLYEPLVVLIALVVYYWQQILLLKDSFVCVVYHDYISHIFSMNYSEIFHHLVHVVPTSRTLPWKWLLDKELSWIQELNNILYIGCNSHREDSNVEVLAECLDHLASMRPQENIHL